MFLEGTRPILTEWWDLMTVRENRLDPGALTNSVNVDTLGVSLARPSGEPKTCRLLHHAPSDLMHGHQQGAQAGLGQADAGLPMTREPTLQAQGDCLCLQETVMSDEA